ncbi:hypothetical protein ACTFIV_003185, partial [Dictyostelium citrinum]
QQQPKSVDRYLKLLTVTVLQDATNNETSSEKNQSQTYGETYERKSLMTLDQEYYEKALVILQSKGFSDKEADQVATTLAVFLPMRFKASAWEEIPPDLYNHIYIYIMNNIYFI